MLLPMHRSSFDRFVRFLREFHPFTLFGAGVAAGSAGTMFARNFFPYERKIKHEIHIDYGPADPRFERSLGQLLGPAFIGGNRVTALHNGDQIFPPMLDAIDGARFSITLESFIYWKGDIAENFSRHLSARARAGIKVHVSLDGAGCDCIDSPLVHEMRDAGCQVEIYNILEPTDLDRLNNRTHRKLLVVDGKVGFIGGVGIADVWGGNAQSPAHWRDSHYQVEGPVVGQMQSAFTDNWMEMAATVLHGDDYFPALERAGDHVCQVFKSSPNEGSDSARLMFLFSIASARQTIHLANSYFIPDDLTQHTLVEACERGVDVQIMVPGPHIDKQFVRDASRTRWGPLLRAGARFFEYEPTMFHCKLLVIDGVWVSVGSCNFDNRSFRLNDEANINVLDAGFGAEQVDVFNRDLEVCREITLEDWENRSPVQKLVDATFALARSQM